MTRARPYIMTTTIPPYSVGVRNGAMARVAASLLTLLGWALTTPATALGYAPKEGERHAEFTLPDIQTSKPVSLKDFRGRKVLLIQFASW